MQSIHVQVYVYIYIRSRVLKSAYVFRVRRCSSFSLSDFTERQHFEQTDCYNSK